MNITRLSIFSLVIVSTALALGSYPTGSTASDDTSEILRISILRMNALGAYDVATWASYTSDHYQSIQDDGEVLTKSAVIARIRPRLTRMHLRGLDIRQYALLGKQRS